MSLVNDALTIKNEVVSGANTAERVGGLLEKMLNQTIVRVDDKTSLPDAVGGIITLSSDTTYEIIGTLDLTGDRLVGALNTCILGSSSENSFITSTGLGVGIPLFSTAFTTPIRHITFKDVDTALLIDADGNSGAYDWTGVNFTNVPNVGIMRNFANTVLTKCAFLNSQGLILDGAFDTFAIDASLLAGDGSAGDIIKVEDTAIISRRFRITYSAIVAFGSTTGLNISDIATIPTEAYILDTINFSGGSTYITGVTFEDNKALFTNCNGIDNSRQVSQYYMRNNATATNIALINTPVKVAGVTINGDLTSKFTNTDNRATYTGATARIFKVTATLSASSGNNNQIGTYISKNGVLLEDSEVYSTTSGTGKAQNVTVQTIVVLDTFDYIEIFVENKTSTTNITVQDLNVIIF